VIDTRRSLNWRILALTPALIALAILHACADVSVSASLSRQSIPVGGAAQLTIEVNGAAGGVSQPQIPPMDGLEIISSGRSQNMSFTNGHMSASVQHSYVIRAIKPGDYTIPPISVEVSGTTFTTQVLAITVTGTSGTSNQPATPATPPVAEDPTEPDPPAQETYEDLFVTLEVDNDKPYVGQQVILTMSFYQLAGIRMAGTPSYTPPTTEGLVAEPLPEPDQQAVMLAGTNYTVIQRRTALFAPAAGDYTIKPAFITYTRNFFDPETTIQSEELTLRVRPLPAARKPDNFCGLVGQMTVGLTADQTRLATGESLTVRVQATGVGDMRRIAAPELPATGDCKVYPAGGAPTIRAQQRGDQQLIGGAASFDYLLVPRESGELTIGPVTMSFFDPDANQYRTATSEPLKIDVRQGTAAAPVAEQHPGDELRYIKTGTRGLRARPPITAMPGFWVLQLLPLIWLGTVLRERAEDVRRQRDPRYRRFVEAFSLAESTLGSQPADKGSHELADEALSGYVADKTFEAATSLSPTLAAQSLTQAGASDELAQRVAQTLSTLRAGRFAPGAGAIDDSALLDQVRDLIAEIERMLEWDGGHRA